MIARITVVKYIRNKSESQSLLELINENVISLTCQEMRRLKLGISKHIMSGYLGIPVVL
jgi:hypothetical protein